MTMIKSKIKELFDNETLRKLAAICDTRRIPSSRDKMFYICQVLKQGGYPVILLGGATNRITFQYHGYCIKIAVDRQGYKDNLVEYAICPELYERRKCVSKTYETSGYMLVCETFRLMPLAEWRARKTEILKILDMLSQEYLLGDVGYLDKNRTNWGVGDDGRVGILDYAYIHRATEDLFICSACGDGLLMYDQNYDILICTNRESCRAKYTYSERKRIQGDQVDLDMIEERKQTSILIGPDEVGKDVQTIDDQIVDGKIRLIHSRLEWRLFQKEQEEKMVEIYTDNELSLRDLLEIATAERDDPGKASQLLREKIDAVPNGGSDSYMIADDYEDGQGFSSAVKPVFEDSEEYPDDDSVGGASLADLLKKVQEAGGNSELRPITEEEEDEIWTDGIRLEDVRPKAAEPAVEQEATEPDTAPASGLIFNGEAL